VYICGKTGRGVAETRKSPMGKMYRARSGRERNERQWLNKNAAKGGGFPQGKKSWGIGSIGGWGSLFWGKGGEKRVKSFRKEGTGRGGARRNEGKKKKTNHKKNKATLAEAKRTKHQMGRGPKSGGRWGGLNAGGGSQVLVWGGGGGCHGKNTEDNPAKKKGGNVVQKRRKKKT